MMQSSNDDLRLSISVCQGKIGVCNSKLFLETVSHNLSGEGALYSFNSIKEFLVVIYEGIVSVEKSHFISLFKLLVENAKNSNESIRSLCGECLGMILSKHLECFKDYISGLNSSDPIIRSTFLAGLKYIHESNDTEEIQAITECLFKGLVDSDLQCKKNSFISLMNFAHSHPQLIRAHFIDLMNIFKVEYKINEKLIEIVDIGGGMKIKNDKALNIRKAIYSTIKILLDKIPEKFTIGETLELLLYGLNDHEDIEAICHACLLKLGNFAPEPFITCLDKMLETFEKKLADAQKTSSEAKVDSKKIFDLTNNIKRLFEELKKVPEIDENARFTEISLNVSKLFEKYKG